MLDVLEEVGARKIIFRDLFLVGKLSFRGLEWRNLQIFLIETAKVRLLDSLA